MVVVNELIRHRYRILGEIGAGGMSVVHLARDERLNKLWAVKQIRGSSDPVRRDLVVRSLTVEAAMIKGLDHPAIPRIVDLIDDDGDLLVVMDYVEGRTLESIIDSDGPQREDDVADWGVQLCDVLEYLHARRPPVVFRDMKPSNVMLTPDGMVKLIDFGIALESGTEDRPHIGDDRTLGTPGYGAPEQFDPNASVDSRADVYALGATLFHLLTGSDPRRNAIVTVRTIRPGLSEGMERIISRATSACPGDRYAGCVEMAYDLLHYRERDRAHRLMLVRRWRGFLAAVVAVAACLAFGGASLIGAAYVTAIDFDHWMRVGSQSTRPDHARAAYLTAIGIKPSSTAPYGRLIALYTADGILSDAEEYEYNTVITQNAELLRADADEWAALSYETGKMYWYYYAGSSERSTADPPSAEGDQRYARMRAASQWMRDAASNTGFAERSMAGVYADIAEFNMGIVPRINDGSDRGEYGPYFGRLKNLVTAAGRGGNDVLGMDSANLALAAMQVYPRKFRADGVDRADMERLLESVGALIESTVPTTESLDGQRRDAIEGLPCARSAVDNAFVDVTGASR
ncbi:serine/threonine protein kinase [Bifidobacterium minimum]|jgi:serine/threonine-protein kinase|uniref:Serine/threonine protein kinase n=1 Tax=Bifidobacterium minimum TaxID=1693 RepID=A0A087BM92_9BIFI|nr:serine/threonine-protein kinase [Bifidobacterium minimum]KFI72142.1 serine/threonine protein kinase [Bifidobacterium minimum]MCH4158569.1 serine/threonine protein kinase [Bifidobacterium minimum]